MPFKPHALLVFAVLTLVGNVGSASAGGKVRKAPHFQKSKPKPPQIPRYAQPYKRPDSKYARLQAEVRRLQAEHNSLLGEYQPGSAKVRANEKQLAQTKRELARTKKGEVERIFDGHVVLL